MPSSACSPEHWGTTPPPKTRRSHRKTCWNIHSIRDQPATTTCPPRRCCYPAIIRIFNGGNRSRNLSGPPPGAPICFARNWRHDVNKLEKIHTENMKTDLPEFHIGDDLLVEVKILEGGKERIQSFRGTVIARNGAGIAQTFTLRRVAFGQGVERVLPLHSPRLASIEVVRHGRVRRAKLYYLRNQIGKAARVKERSYQ
ncbi:MAG: 50S ribosomal protein L19 [Victivallales bacterium]|nr:50S ribosomal protein L19 [Victivallales bacterium]MBT7163523.1 50S ribosomal protein L19 [Victivallales bacterium]MBT7303332.1 50S ribosomal protein L19 [Victivallales bacterium]